MIVSPLPRPAHLSSYLTGISVIYTALHTHTHTHTLAYTQRERERFIYIERDRKGEKEREREESVICDSYEQ